MPILSVSTNLDTQFLIHQNCVKTTWFCKALTVEAKHSYSSGYSCLQLQRYQNIGGISDFCWPTSKKKLQQIVPEPSHYTASWNCNLLPTLNKHLFNGTSVLLLHIMTYQSFLLMCNSILSVVRFAGPFFLSKLPLVAEKRKSCSFRRWSWATKRYKKICGTWFFFAAIFNYDHFGSSEWCSNFKCYASPFFK